MRIKDLSSVLAVLAVALCACGSGPGQADRERLSELEEIFGDRYVFALERDLYLRVRTTSGEPLNEDDARQIYRAFWFDEGGLRSDTTYVYLNLYDADGTFALQLYWDPREKSILRSATEHY